MSGAGKSGAGGSGAPPPDADALVAAGWRLGEEGTQFNAAAGPYWTRHDAAGREVGLLTGDRHGNGHVGTVHGGALMTFADIALGIGVVDAAKTRNCVTLQLQMQFAGTAPIGAFVTCRPELVRRTSTVVFVRGLLRAGDRIVASADGIWKLLDPAKMAAIRG